MRKLLVVVVSGLVLAGCGGTSVGEAGVPSPETSTPSASTGTTRPVASGPAPVQLRVVVLASDGTSSAGAAPTPPAGGSARFADYSCTDGADAGGPEEYVLACDATSNKYLLAPASWSGTVRTAKAQVMRGQAAWSVVISLGSDGARAFAALSRELVDSGGRCALVVAGRVLSAVVFNGVINDGAIQITGDFTEASANALADQLTGR